MHREDKKKGEQRREAEQKEKEHTRKEELNHQMMGLKVIN